MKSEKEILSKCGVELKLKEDVVDNKASKSWPVAAIPIDMANIMKAAREELKEHKAHYRTATLKAENIQLTKTQISKLNSPNYKAVLTINIPIYQWLWWYIDNTLAYILDCPRYAFKVVEYRTPLTTGKMENLNLVYVAMHPDFVRWGLLDAYVEGMDECMAVVDRERDMFYKLNKEWLDISFTTGLLVSKLCKRLSIDPVKLKKGENASIMDYKGWEYRYCWPSNAGVDNNILCRHLINEFLDSLALNDNIVAYMYSCAAMALEEPVKINIKKK